MASRIRGSGADEGVRPQQVGDLRIQRQHGDFAPAELPCGADFTRSRGADAH